MIIFANTTIDALAITVMLLLFISSARNRERSFSQSVFNLMLICMAVYLLADLASWQVEGKSFEGSYGVQLALNSIVYFSQFLLSFFWLIYTDHWINRSPERIRRRIWLYLLPLAAEIALLVINAFTGCVFYINRAHFYTRGALFMPSLLIYYDYALFSLLLSAAAFFRARTRARRIYCLWMIGFMVLPLCAAAMQFFVIYGISLMAPFYACSILMVYLNVHQKQLVEERQKLARREAELARARVSITLSQIQPHFLYNSLTAIYGLCETDPPLAQNAVKLFSSYLRFNMDSLRDERPIPFDAELEHVRVYLNIEKLRFDKKLSIVWDIAAHDFMIPSLTVQPLVENAVKHGICKNRGGTLTIASREFEDRYTVSVSDDGPGFDVSAPPREGSIGLENVRIRLSIISSASLAVQSGSGAGTTATIILAKEKTLETEPTKPTV